MTNISHIDELSKQWWYLRNSNSHSLNAIQENNKDNDSGNGLNTKDAILLAAFNEIYQRGFQAASLSNILKNTGITKGALYHHFDNKVELGYSVLDEVIRSSIHSKWIEPLNNSDDPITVLKRIIRETGASITQADVCLGCPLNNLAQEMSPIDDGFKDRIATIYQEWQDAIEAACDRGKKACNVTNSIDSKEIALLFIASLQGCLGFAKSVQKLDILMSCGQGVIDRLESLRPSKKSIIKNDVGCENRVATEQTYNGANK